MYMVREVLNCRPGTVRQLVDKFKEMGGVMEEMGLDPFRIYTDVSGESFWTLVLEREYETLDELRELEARVMGDTRVQSIMAGYHDLVRRGRREIYSVES